MLSLFKNFVAKNRPQVDIDAIATGETWLGPDALSRNMVDELSTLTLTLTLTVTVTLTLMLTLTLSLTLEPEPELQRLDSGVRRAHRERRTRRARRATLLG